MKVKCPHCGKKFNYEVYSGLCPGCGTYMRPGDIGKPPKKKTVKSSVNISETSPEKPESKKKRIKNKPQAVLCSLLLLAILTAPLAARGFEKQKQKPLLKEWYVTDLPEESFETEQPFSFLNDTITIHQGNVFSLEGLEAPTRFSYLSFPYTTSHGEIYSWNSEVFLRTDDLYQRPLSSYDLANTDEEMLHKLEALKLSQTPYSYDGQFVFLVPDSVTELELYLYEKEAVNDNITKAARLCRIPVQIER